MRNLGDIAMLQVAIRRIRTFGPSVELHVLTDDPKRLKRYCPGVTPVPAVVTMDGRGLWTQQWNLLGGMHKLLPRSSHARLVSIEDRLRTTFPQLARSWMTRRFGKRGVSTEPMDCLFALVASMDGVVATGGGYLTDSFAQHAVNVLHLLWLAQHAGRPTLLFGQGLGPIHSPRLRSLCRQVFPKLDALCLREGRASLPLALSLGVSQHCVNVTGDDAIELAHSQTPHQLGEAIGINLRVAAYSQVGDKLLHEVREVVHRVAGKLQTGLMPVPISLHEEDSDVQSIERVLEPGDQAVAQLDTPEKVILQIGQCRLVVTGSYHAGVFALSQGVSVVGLAKSRYYCDKFHGLAEQFAVGCQVVEMDKDDFPKHLENTIIRAWQSAPANRARLLAQAEAQIESGHRAYTTLQNMLK